MPENPEEALARAIREGRDAALVTAIRVDGGPPSRAGAKVVVIDGRAVAGTLGCSEFDSAAVEAAGSMPEPGLRTFEHDLGRIEVFIEPMPAAPALVIGGSSPVGDELAAMAPAAGFHVGRTVPGAGEVFAVHVDHDDDGVAAFLEALLRRDPPPRFLGVVGSRRHTGHHLEALAARGFAPEQLDRINSPVGLSLGAQTPGEIAVSILAGLVAVRRGAEVRWLDPPRS